MAPAVPGWGEGKNRPPLPRASRRPCAPRWGCTGTPCAAEAPWRRLQPARRPAAWLRATARQWSFPGPSGPFAARWTGSSSLVASFPSAHLERIALDDGDHQARKPVPVLGQRTTNLLDRTPVGVLQAAAQGVGQHLFRQAAAEGVLPSLQDSLELGGPLEGLTAGPRAGRIDGEIPVALPPGPDSIVVFQAEPQGVHALMARGAFRLGPVLLHALAQGAGQDSLLGLAQVRHARRGRRW